MRKMKEKIFLTNFEIAKYLGIRGEQLKLSKSKKYVLNKCMDNNNSKISGNAYIDLAYEELLMNKGGGNFVLKRYVNNEKNAQIYDLNSLDIMRK